MRVAILLAAVMISSALGWRAEPAEGAAVVFVFLIFIIIDGLEFIANLKR